MKSIDKAVARLEASTGRIARRNARKALQGLLSDVWKKADVAYPPIRKDGTEIIRVKKRGVCCPICDVPLKGYVELAKHMGKIHRMIYANGRTCWCGKRFEWLDKGNESATNLARHLAGVGRENLKTHAVIGALGNHKQGESR